MDSLTKTCMVVSLAIRATNIRLNGGASRPMPLAQISKSGIVWITTTYVPFSQLSRASRKPKFLQITEVISAWTSFKQYALTNCIRDCDL